MSPCKGCESRAPNCHANCEKYKAWKAEYNERKEVIMKNRIEAYHEKNEYFARQERQKKESAIKRVERYKNGGRK